MVRAILAGTKTQTRRLVKPVGNDEGFVLQDYGDGFWPYRSEDGESGFYRDRNGYDTEERIKCPYGRPGDRIWVKESHRLVDCTCTETCRIPGHVWYEADCSGYQNVSLNRLRPSIHMPRWASRITLEVTAVTVERLQDISEADAIAEGIIRQSTTGWFSVPGLNGAGTTARAGYALLWNSINGPGSWDANPCVWCVSFKRLEAA